MAHGTIGELNRSTVLDADPVVLQLVADEVTTEPTRSAVEQALEAGRLIEGPQPVQERLREAANVLDHPEGAADVHLLGAVLGEIRPDRPAAGWQ